MKLVLVALVALGIVATIAESRQRAEHLAAALDCMARTHKTQAQCEEAP